MERHRPNQDAVREQLRQSAPPAADERPDVEPRPGEEPADEVVPTRGAEPGGAQAADATAPSGTTESVPSGTVASAPDGADASDSEDPLQKVERERDEYLDLAQRTRAELENFRKRAARESAQAGERAKANLVRELLPVLDNLERALGSAGDAEQHLAEGVRMVHGQLVAALEREGIQAFDPGGEAFDPECHEALSTREDGESGRVLDVVEKGYRLNGTVLRPARVVVSA